ncbi:MAG: DinB family protein [Verrucomicrobiota bacterium]
MPVLAATTTWEKATARLRREADRCLALTAPLDEATLRRPVLIKRIRGIEDSSRHWSPAMTLRHLVIVGEGIAGIIKDLRQHERPDRAVRIQDVKPEPECGPEQRRAFDLHVRRYLKRTAEPPRREELTTTHAHPWFGEMNAHQWHVLASAHVAVHRRQIEKILATRRGA